MFNDLKSSIIAFFFVFLLSLQAVAVWDLRNKSNEYTDIKELILQIKDIKKDIFKNKTPTNKYMFLDENNNIVFSSLKKEPSRLNFDVLFENSILYLKDCIFLDNKQKFIIVSKDVSDYNYKFYVFSFFLIFIIMFYFYCLNTIKSQHEQKKIMSTFFNDAMHELKTPLGVATINLEMLEVKNKNTHRIKSALKQMKVTYEDVEYFIKNSHVVFPKIKLDFSKFLRMRVRFLSTIAHNKEIQITQNIQDDIFIFISEIEATRLIDNTISNAIKYSKENSKINIFLKKDNDFAIFSVEDFGRGIKDINAIWQRYKREDSSNGGFGLGLNIVLGICNKYEIKKDVISSPQKGSTFTYKIPLYKEKLLDRI